MLSGLSAGRIWLCTQPTDMRCSFDGLSARVRLGPDVPVKTIEVRDPAMEAIPENEREVIGEKVSYRLAQQPGSYVVLKYVRPVVKRRDTQTISTAPAPVDAGITLSRSTLIHWASRSIDLLAPITAAQSAQVLSSEVLAMDETSIKAGREAKGKMRTGWLWPVYGDCDEVVFHYAPSRAHRHVHAFLGEYCGTLLSDGYEAYAAYAAQRPTQVTHALCWSHTRRYFERAKDAEPEAVAEALAMMGAMYAHEKQIRADGLLGEDKRAYRQAHTRAVVETFWRWCRRQCHRPELLPKNPLAKALSYAQARRTGLEVFLDDPAVAIDTNHLERALRPIPLGKRNWLFASTEVGAQRVGIIQSLLVTCRLHGVDAYTYLVDVLQRISGHPAHRAIELTPRRWKSLFADDPLRSDLGPHHHVPQSRPILAAYTQPVVRERSGRTGVEEPVMSAFTRPLYRGGPLGTRGASCGSTTDADARGRTPEPSSNRMQVDSTWDDVERSGDSHRRVERKRWRDSVILPRAPSNPRRWETPCPILPA